MSIKKKSLPFVYRGIEYRNKPYDFGDICNICNTNLSEEKYYTGEFGSLWRSCEACMNHSIELNNAISESRRFTSISTFRNGSEWDGGRCSCGSVSLPKLNHCIRCSRINRLLEKKQSEANILSKILTDLRREIRAQKKIAEEKLTLGNP